MAATSFAGTPLGKAHQLKHRSSRRPCSQIFHSSAAYDKPARASHGLQPGGEAAAVRADQIEVFERCQLRPARGSGLLKWPYCDATPPQGLQPGQHVGPDGCAHSQPSQLPASYQPWRQDKSIPL